MEIKTNTFYKTRSGLKARIYALDAGGENTVQGAILVDGVWMMQDWRLDGSFYPDKANNWDIVDIWTEPKPKLRAWLYRETHTGGFCSNGFTVFFSTENVDIKNATRAEWLDQP